MEIENVFVLDSCLQKIKERENVFVMRYMRVHNWEVSIATLVYDGDKREERMERRMWEWKFGFKILRRRKMVSDL